MNTAKMGSMSMGTITYVEASVSLTYDCVMDIEKMRRTMSRAVNVIRPKPFPIFIFLHQSCPRSIWTSSYIQ